MTTTAHLILWAESLTDLELSLNAQSARGWKKDGAITANDEFNGFFVSMTREVDEIIYRPRLDDYSKQQLRDVATAQFQQHYDQAFRSFEVPKDSRLSFIAASNLLLDVRTSEMSRVTFEGKDYAIIEAKFERHGKPFLGIVQRDTWNTDLLIRAECFHA